LNQQESVWSIGIGKRMEEGRSKVKDNNKTVHLNYHSGLRVRIGKEANAAQLHPLSLLLLLLVRLVPSEERHRHRQKEKMRTRK
jgi:hypothetical protein